MQLKVRCIETIAQRVSKWAKLEEKSSILLTKPQSFENINFNELIFKPLAKDPTPQLNRGFKNGIVRENLFGASEYGNAALLKSSGQFPAPKEYFNKRGELLPYLELGNLQIAESLRGQGSGSKLLQEVVKKTKELGYGGRILLEAGYWETSKFHPVFFYIKNGFKVLDPNRQKIVEELISSGSKNLPEGFGKCIMYNNSLA